MTFGLNTRLAAAQAYRDGASLVEVAASLHCAVKTAREVLLSEGVVIRGKGRPRKS